jgi:hypothetical protein
MKVKTMSECIMIDFGAMSASVSEQIKKQGFTWEDEVQGKAADKDAEAIVRLNLRGIITDSSARSARNRLFKKIKANIKK